MIVASKVQGTVTRFGYRRIHCKDRKFRFEHVIVWESHFGSVPEGKEIHHVNGNKLDNRIENLKILTRLEHKRLHSGCIRVGNDWLKPCRRCHWYRPIDTDYYEYPGRSGALGTCKRCLVDLAIEAKRRRNIERKRKHMR